MPTEKARQISEDGVQIAADHKCTAQAVISEGKAEEVILNTANTKECNLIVVGAYGHSKIRELILGSTTTHLINHSHLPVMLVR